ncbi:MAG: amino acid--tRNA ligase-related protein, partial [Patescibacteria group bacterium]
MKRILSREVSRLVGQTVTIRGWVQTIRHHSKVAFLDLRDRTGLTQVVINESEMPLIKELTVESVITATGKVASRPQTLVNPNIISGSVELQLSDLTVDSLAANLPFDPHAEGVGEETRLQYRYLDLRSKRLTGNLKQRQLVNDFSRGFFFEREFVEVETPYISKSTPEGARDYLIPSRVVPGSFYALPQSPQQYKQLLMVGGLERYFQITRCFRDEDSRGDRQPEFTQLDLELSFTDQTEILTLVENWLGELIAKLYPEKTLTFPSIPRLSYQEVINQHATDKPDLRRDKTNGDELAIAFVVDFPLLEWKEK